jgi:ubiquitin-like protein Pup
MPQQQVQQTRVSQPGHDAAGRSTYSEDVDQAVADAADRAATDQETLDAADDLLDEIDAILTEEEEFAVRYVQKGGE